MQERSILEKIAAAQTVRNMTSDPVYKKLLFAESVLDDNVEMLADVNPQYDPYELKDLARLGIREDLDALQEGRMSKGRYSLLEGLQGYDLIESYVKF